MQFGKTRAPDFPKLAVQFCIDVRSHFGDHRVITLIDTQSKSIIDHTIWSPDKKVTETRRFHQMEKRVNMYFVLFGLYMGQDFPTL